MKDVQPFAKKYLRYIPPEMVPELIKDLQELVRAPSGSRKPISIDIRAILAKGQPMVHVFQVYDDGTEELVTQWTPADAWHHAIAVLEATEATKSDAFIFSFMQSKVGLDENRAAHVLVDYRAWREAGNKSPLEQQ